MSTEPPTLRPPWWFFAAGGTVSIVVRFLCELHSLRNGIVLGDALNRASIIIVDWIG
jgi:hypothetical protein